MIWISCLKIYCWYLADEAKKIKLLRKLNKLKFINKKQIFINKLFLLSQLKLWLVKRRSKRNSNLFLIQLKNRAAPVGYYTQL